VPVADDKPMTLPESAAATADDDDDDKGYIRENDEYNYTCH
jgi:hypothetical protein